MSSSFDVESVLLCEYASQDIQGRNMLIGIFPNVISFDHEPVVWPSFFVNIYMRPLEEKFGFDVHLSDPTEKIIVSFKMTYEKEDKPDPRERVVFTAQIPPVKFYGAGLYKISINHNKSKILEREFHVDIGASLPIKLGRISGVPEIPVG